MNEYPPNWNVPTGAAAKPMAHVIRLDMVDSETLAQIAVALERIADALEKK